jgi:hypothetical protein
MARRVYLHIGTMKSGTTYLQSCLDVNRRHLRSAGLLWPAAIDNFRAVNDLLNTNPDRPGLVGTWEALVHNVQAHDGDALISNELLAAISRANMERLIGALSPAEVHVIITARDLGRVIPSQWQETTRNRHTTPWADFVASVLGQEGSDKSVRSTFWRKHGVASIINRWSEHVPPDRITVVTVPPSGSSPTLLVDRFTSVFNVDTAGWEQPSFARESLGAWSAELMRRLNSHTDDFDWVHYQWGLKQTIARHTLTARSSKEPPIALTQDQLDWVRRRASLMTSLITDSGVRVVGDLTDLVPADHAIPGSADPGETTDRELLEVAMDGIVGLSRMFTDMRIEHQSLIDTLESRLPDVHRADPEDADESGPDRVEPLGHLSRRGRRLRSRIENMYPVASELD